MTQVMSGDSALDRARLLWLYRRMLTIRLFEEKLSRLFYTGQLPGFIHLYIGEEAIAVGVCSLLTDKDTISSTHRGHGHVLAKGGDIRYMMAELYGRATGYCKGKGGSMHIADFKRGMIGANGIVGGGMPLIVGAALAHQMQGSNAVGVGFFGDGAANEGIFHESLNLAAIWKLPVVFVCENNGFTEYMPTYELTAGGSIAARAAAYGMPGVDVDATDVLKVRAVAQQAVDRARRGEGPTLIEARCWRWMAHNEGEEAFIGKWAYRTREQLSDWKARDPILKLGLYLQEAGQATAEDLDAIRPEIDAELQSAIEFARSSPLPPVESILDDVFA
jgi:acetoin:2,6-dichlorophenolindophenol oxidoreductase subunit alpha